MKNDSTEILGIVLSKRKKVYKVNCITKEIIDTYNTLSEAADKCGMDQRKLSPFILKNTVIDDSHFYTYTNAYL